MASNAHAEGEYVALHNIAILQNTATVPTLVLVTPEHTGINSHPHVPAAPEGTGHTVHLQPNRGTSVSLNSAQSIPYHPWTEDPELRAILSSLPAKSITEIE